MKHLKKLLEQTKEREKHFRQEHENAITSWHRDECRLKILTHSAYAEGIAAAIAADRADLEKVRDEMRGNNDMPTDRMIAHDLCASLLAAYLEEGQEPPYVYREGDFVELIGEAAGSAFSGPLMVIGVDYRVNGTTKPGTLHLITKNGRDNIVVDSDMVRLVADPREGGEE